MDRYNMKFAINLLGGLTGPLVSNVIQGSAKKLFKEAPEIDKVGEEAIKKTNRTVGKLLAKNIIFPPDLR